MSLVKVHYTVQRSLFDAQFLVLGSSVLIFSKREAKQRQSNRYVTMLRYFFKPRFAEFMHKIHEEDLNEVWFQQYGATAHTATRSMELVREFFPAYIISRREDIKWPPRSPNLAP